MKVDVLLGLQWGDEGKGKIVDVLTPNYKIIARFQGGPNAGHTLEFSGIKHVLHTIPSGIFRKDSINIVGNGVVIDPVIFRKELEALKEMEVDYKSKLFLSKKAHLILPTHRLLDAASEESKGKKKIGSTLKGIGPAYMDKTGRNGLRIGDISENNFREKYETLLEKHRHILSRFDKGDVDISKEEDDWFEAIEVMKELKHIESEHFINKQLKQGNRVLAEGAQGSLLDIDFGSYPYVTSSSTICAGACTGLGVAPTTIGEVIGISKAYCTRVGSGPFPTELEDEDGQLMRDRGNEYGSTTGRPRRCGWLDLPALRYSIMLNGVTQLIIMKADVLDGFETIKICEQYEYKGDLIDYLPYDISPENVKPTYKEMKGWNQDITALESMDEIPVELNDYITYLEDRLEVPVTMVSVGPDRTQTIILENALV